MAARYPGFLTKKVMMDAYTSQTTSTGVTYPEVNRLLKQYQNEGALIMDYAGHGREYQLATEAILRISDFQTFTNKNLPLWITASCDIMPFDGMAETIGESAVVNHKGGAVAFYGTTRTVYAAENKPLNIAYLKHVLSMDSEGKPMTIGEAQRLANNELISTGSDRTTNKLQYSLLGDPALRLNRPTMQIVIDDINGKQPGVDDITLKAGSTATVKGHVVSNGTKDTTFKGIVTATVRDTRELITCKMNNKGETSEPFVFYDRPKTLYNGNDSVRGGEFQLTFAVPHDINYAEDNGLINTFAVNEDHTRLAHGAEEGFYLNGFEDAANDGIGPSIYCYLNSEDFTFGGEVNSTPFFVAQISDKDGINASGAGIGHDMTLIIDGDTEKSYNLNDNFTFDYESYTSGQTYYALPALSEGKHTLKFRAWDILNNSSTTTLDFVVKKSIQPNIVDVYATNNPARESTTFVVAHNFCGAELNLEIDVMDASGRLLWSTSKSETAATNTMSQKWDLQTDSGGKLNTGIYLYRIKLSSNGSSYASKTQKLIIIQ